MKTNWLTNPFERIAGWQALGIGLFSMVLTAVFGKLNHVFFDGALDIHIFPHTYAQAFLAQVIDWGVLTLVLWVAGLLFSKSNIRLIDVAGTVALSRAPMLFIALAGFLPILPSFSAVFSDPVRLIVFTSLCVVVCIWMIALLYKAYSTSCNLTGKRGVLSFIGALLVAETISKILIIFLLSGNPFSSNNMGQTANFSIPEGQTIHQTAEVVVEALKQSDTNIVWNYFDEPMQKGVPKMQLKATWLSVSMSKGKLMAAETKIEPQMHEGYSILLIPCTFERGKLNLQLAFNNEGRISGFYFK